MITKDQVIKKIDQNFIHYGITLIWIIHTTLLAGKLTAFHSYSMYFRMFLVLSILYLLFMPFLTFGIRIPRKLRSHMQAIFSFGIGVLAALSLLNYLQTDYIPLLSKILDGLFLMSFAYVSFFAIKYEGKKVVNEDYLIVEENIPIEMGTDEPVAVLVILRITLLLLLPVLSAIYTVILFFLMFFRGQ
ncbi:MAG: hypothetical protein KKE16_02915 [Firmicutes bacterium]|nr:hypothetical protein [Bacillota bacterium]